MSVPGKPGHTVRKEVIYSMEFICHQCGHVLQIPDEKVSRIPPGKVATVPCPKCGIKVTIQSSPDTEKKGKASAVEPVGGADAGAYDATEKPFDFIEEEGLTALICESDSGVAEKIEAALASMEYHVTAAESVRDVLKKMRYHNYDLIVVNDEFDTRDPDANSVLTYLERLSPSVRRTVYVVLVSRRCRTMDNMTAYHKSVNLVINPENLDDLGKILNRGITEKEFFYRVFNDTLKKLGRV